MVTENLHGSIALIDDLTPVILLGTQSDTDKIFSNAMEIKARGGHIFSIYSHAGCKLWEISDDRIVIPATSDEVAPILTNFILQMLAYYTALSRNKNVDKPRNLAKSVTVE